MEAPTGRMGEEKVSVLPYLSVLQSLPMSTSRAVSSAILHYRSQALFSGYCWPNGYVRDDGVRERFSCVCNYCN